MEVEIPSGTKGGLGEADSLDPLKPLPIPAEKICQNIPT